MYQQLAWVVSISLIALLAIVFFNVLRTSSECGVPDDVSAKTGRWRTGLIWGLTAFFIPIIGYSLIELPYVRNSIDGIGAVEVQATGHQWYWDISRTELPLGKTIAFKVTSADVNHGFAIYDPDMKILTQTQAMPGVVNELRYTFSRPGVYKILCLEYCGVAHHSMMTELHVVAQ